MTFREDSGALVDATFSVEHDQSGTSVVFESRGGGDRPRNTEYAKGLEILLARLGARDVVLADAVLDTQTTSSLPPEQRRLDLDGFDYPIQLGRIADYQSLRRVISTAQARIGRRPGASGAGNPTKRIRLHLKLGAPVAPEALALYLLDPNPSPCCWAVLCDPDLYDIQAASSALDEGTWNLPLGDPRVGDQIVFWKAKGRGGDRGIVAVGEVLDGPRMMPNDDDSARYWLQPPPPEEPRRRIRIRYQKPPNAPLWLDGPHHVLLNDLSVARAQGNKLYRVSAEQAERLSAALGTDGLDAPSGVRRQRAYRPFERAPRPTTEERDTALLAMRFDPSTRDRALNAHGDVQEALADKLLSAGLVPVMISNPDVDLAWESADGRLNIVEIKSITEANETYQLRLGLGQVLHYREAIALQNQDRQPSAFLVIEQAPSDPVLWQRVCCSARVTLTWAPEFTGIPDLDCPALQE